MTTGKTLVTGAVIIGAIYLLTRTQGYQPRFQQRYGFAGGYIGYDGYRYV